MLPPFFLQEMLISHSSRWQNKVKLLSVMIHLVLFRLLVEEPGATHKLVDNILSASLAPLEFV
jgi:hypothetical protein